MKYGWRAVAVIGLILFSLGPSASAQWYGGRFATHRQSPPRPVPPQQVHWSPEFRGYPSYESYRYHMNERYPKFYGGFHSNQLYNMGFPTGDIGIRTNGIYPTPWSY